MGEVRIVLIYSVNHIELIAFFRSKVVGQQSDKMTEVAQEAREIADDLDQIATKLVDDAKQAKNLSIEAYDKIKNTHLMQQNISENARKLKAESQNLEQHLNRTREWTKQVSEGAREVGTYYFNLLTFPS